MNPKLYGFERNETMTTIDYTPTSDDERKTIFRYHKQDENLSIIQFIDNEMMITDVSLLEFCSLGELLLQDVRKEYAPRHVG